MTASRSAFWTVHPGPTTLAAQPASFRDEFGLSTTHRARGRAA